MVRAALAGALMLSATVLGLASTTAPALAQTLKDSKCTGRPGIPWDEQIAGCTNAIKSGRHTGKELAAAFTGRAAAHRAKGDLERAIQDYDHAIKLDPNEATAFYYRGIAHGMRGETGPAIQDSTQAIRLDPKNAGALYSRGLGHSLQQSRQRLLQKRPG
jgi:tetratricopeptide (TPR) repeat protein